MARAQSEVCWIGERRGPGDRRTWGQSETTALAQEASDICDAPFVPGRPLEISEVQCAIFEHAHTGRRNSHPELWIGPSLPGGSSVPLTSARVQVSSRTPGALPAHVGRLDHPFVIGVLATALDVRNPLLQRTDDKLGLLGMVDVQGRHADRGRGRPGIPDQNLE